VLQAHVELEEAAKALAYLEKRQEQMRYPEFVAAGWPLGSGMVESANKLVVEERLKGAGMHWAEENVNPMLALRNAWCNGRWDETWLLIEQEQRRQVCVRRAERRAGRTPLPACVPPVPAPAVVTERIAPAAAPPLLTPKPRHPWSFARSIRRQSELAGAA
jgi:hypothetical protein